MGDLSSMYYALGLHQDRDMPPHIPYYQYDLRRRYAATLFGEDKVLSTLLGRPPRIAGRYSYNIMCADIDDRDLYLQGNKLDEKLQDLDENGWNKDGKFRGATSKRLKVIVCQFREEVLEICLGAHQDDIYGQGQ